MMNANKYLIAAIVLVSQFLFLWRANNIMNFGWSALGYFIVLGVIAVLIVIGVNALIVR